ncbi:hypothetical protein [Sphingomonas sp. Leaf10]|uniref:hypothetical protein n=1 Tax=Sphingomonas sp. Leaf10 TaxID=1735676 RepID=UPI000701A3B7|nr:hypothetical protein [Sphingomonas sp. Leaf10]KQM30509.1 hypothetical protein ASE59_08010 [Sphingomonas sp. Leaf10]
MVAIAACQPERSNDPAKLAVFDIEPQSQAVAADPGSLTPMTSEDIRRSLIACLLSPSNPYAPDDGPICLRPDGSWIAYTGEGNPQGRYTIVGNEVRTVHAGVPGTPRRLAFYRSAIGRIYLRDPSLRETLPVEIEPSSESPYLNGM